MAVKDYIGPVTRLKQELVFELKEFYSILARMIKDRGFSGYLENMHHEYNNPDGSRTIVFSWTAAKKLEPYVRACIDIDVKAVFTEAVVEKEGNEKTMLEGTLEMDLRSYLLRDIEDEWGFRGSNPTRRFLRDLYDKFLNVDKISSHEKRLKGDFEALVSDLKAYMKIHKQE